MSTSQIHTKYFLSGRRPPENRRGSTRRRQSHRHAFRNIWRHGRAAVTRHWRTALRMSTLYIVMLRREVMDPLASYRGNWLEQYIQQQWRHSAPTTCTTWEMVNQYQALPLCWGNQPKSWIVMMFHREPVGLILVCICSRCGTVVNKSSRRHFTK